MLRNRFFRVLTSLLTGALFVMLSTACKHTLPPAPDSTASDTTSHAFTWQIETLGDGSSSMLYDVCIIDENDIWAVGEIYLKDSTGQFIYPTYNAAHWDGTTWNLLQIPTRIFGTNSFMVAPLNAIFSFGKDDIWVSTGGQVVRFNGQNWEQWEFLFDDLNDTTFGGINKFWGTSSSALWGVGNKGNIFKYNGSVWQKLESGTDLDFRDIWGATNEKTGELEILAVAGKPRLALPRRKIFKLTDNTVETLADSGIVQASMAGVWFSPGEKYIIVGNGIYRKNHLDEPLWQGAPLEFTEFFSSHVRGIAANDIVVVGAFGDILHFNGSTWKQYSEPRLAGGLFKVSFSHQIVIAVGYTGNRAAVVIGRRQ